jgi:2-polyprenyl-3-methyl-5-hydroxy-6-metoxy-1,4-benzoquinol methylase
MTSGSRCALCGAEDGPVVLEAGGARLRRCARCGLVRTEAGGEAPYDEAYYSAHELADRLAASGPRERLIERAYEVFMDPRSSWIRRLPLLPIRNRLGGLPPGSLAPGDLLDVGSGDGAFMFRAQRRGWRVVGVEVNEAAVASARRAGLQVVLGDLASAEFTPSSFDVVRAWHVLEHVPDPVGLLKEMARLVRPEGVVIVGVPDFGSAARRMLGARWSGLQPQFHLHHFERRTLRQAFANAGLDVVALGSRSVGTLYATLSNRSRLLGSPPAWAATMLADDAFDLAGWGDSLEAVARLRKPD